MSGRFLLDTNVVVALFKDDPVVHERLAQRPMVLVSAIVLGELYYGAQKSERLAKNLRTCFENHFVALASRLDMRVIMAM